MLVSLKTDKTLTDEHGVKTVYRAGRVYGLDPGLGKEWASEGVAEIIGDPDPTPVPIAERETPKPKRARRK